MVGRLKNRFRYSLPVNWSKTSTGRSGEVDFIDLDEVVRVQIPARPFYVSNRGDQNEAENI